MTRQRRAQVMALAMPMAMTLLVSLKSKRCLFIEVMLRSWSAVGLGQIYAARHGLGDDHGSDFHPWTVLFY